MEVLLRIFMSNSLLKDIEEILIALQVKQSKYKYTFITELKFNQKTKINFRSFSLIKYHKELRYDETIGKRKRVNVRDEAVRGNLASILNYLVNDLKGIDTT